MESLSRTIWRLQGQRAQMLKEAEAIGKAIAALEQARANTKNQLSDTTRRHRERGRLSPEAIQRIRQGQLERRAREKREAELRAQGDAVPSHPTKTARA